MAPGSPPPPRLDSELECFRQQWLADLRAGPAPASPVGRGSLLGGDDVDQPPPPRLVSALDHYEEAMALEAQGSLGDSVKLYRRAYRLDSRVDRRYREKHFPSGLAASETPVAVAAPAAAAASTCAPLSTDALIASFAHLGIEPSPPPVAGAPPPRCPVAELPAELLVLVLCRLAAADPGALATVALVCKRLAYLVASESRVWRTAALSPDFGFPAMHTRFRRSLEWLELPPDDHVGDGHRHSHAALVPAVYASWRDMFRSRPRVRFNGCYISTVNYVRSGQMSTNQATWGAGPVHIVTYYRYLRFFRDGSAISLLTTCPPVDVVHHLTRDLLRLHRDAAHPPTPAPMRLALRGRWRLDAAEPGAAADLLFVETEGVGPKYVYRMDLALRSAGSAARNNKIVWRGFYSYNKLTDDWAEFGLRNDKPFFFSRVKSYGMGE